MILVSEKRMDWMPPIYIMCHPEHEPVRYKILCDHLPKRGIPLEKVHWVRGPWGSELTSETYFKHYDPFAPRFGTNLALTFKSAGLLRGEVSLVLTFLETIRQALQNPSEYSLVFESDVVLRTDFLERFHSLMKNASQRQDWSYISLGEGVGTRPPGHSHSYFAETQLFDPQTGYPFRCTDSMLFRRSFLESLHKSLQHFRECLDWELNVQLAVNGGQALWADPPLVEPGSGRWRFLSLLPG